MPSSQIFWKFDSPKFHVSFTTHSSPPNLHWLLLFYVSRAVRAEKGLGSWITALMCWLTPDTSAEPKSGTCVETSDEKKMEGENSSSQLNSYQFLFFEWNSNTLCHNNLKIWKMPEIKWKIGSVQQLSKTYDGANAAWYSDEYRPASISPHCYPTSRSRALN